jgi:hypothetical protein
VALNGPGDLALLDVQRVLQLDMPEGALPRADRSPQRAGKARLDVVEYRLLQDDELLSQEGAVQ